MHKNIASEIVEIVKKFSSINWNEVIENTYPNTPNLESVELSTMSISEFISLSKKIFLQFGTELSDRINSIAYSNQFSPPRSGLLNLQTELENYLACVARRDFESASVHLESLTYYQVLNGFYNTHTEENTSQTSDLIAELVEKNRLLSLNIKNEAVHVKKILNDLAIQKKDIEEFSIKKREELQQITSNLSMATSQTNQIGELLNKSIESNSRLTGILEQQENNKNKSERAQEELKQLYESERQALSENAQEITLKIDLFNKVNEENLKHLSFIEGKKAFFDERIEYLNELIGREVGASLFETFKQRKTELKNQVDFWKWAVPIMTILSIIWIFCIFKSQSSITDISLWWQMFGLNSLKTLPSILLLYFTINQYRKERNFQEEYAFKSAVALTIDAYAGRLKEDANKDSLIMEAVLNLYKTPIEDSSSKTKLKNKQVWDLINKSTDTITNLTKSK